MSQNFTEKNQSKKIIVIRRDRSSSASSAHSQSQSKQKHFTNNLTSYINNNQPKSCTYSNSLQDNHLNRQQQKLESHLLNNELSLIQNEILELRLQITKQISQKYELQKRLNNVLEQQKKFMSLIYKEINKDYLKDSQRNADKQNTSSNIIQKFSGIDFNQLASQIIFLSKNNKLNEQTLKSQQKYIFSLKEQNSGLRKKISRLINENLSKKSIESQTQILNMQEISISTINHFSFNQTPNIKKMNAQVQTQQKRIGLAQTIQNVRLNRLNSKLSNNPRISPYRNYLASQQSKLTISKQRKHQNVEGNTVKKINLQSIKDKRLNQKNNKKKVIASTPYINHLLLESKQITIQQTTTIEGNQQTRLNLRLQNPKSQLSYRRPIHRSRSHSQQQIPSSSQKSRSNYSNSRMTSSYSINPLNKYGQKRLCNQINGKKIRKISRLSQQSQQLEERMKQLQQQQKKLQQKYNLLAQMKLLKPVTINKSRSKCNPLN